MKKNIKSWPENDRPREKLFKLGAHQLTDTELLAILLRTGSKGESAIDLAREILNKFGDFRNMNNTDIRDWEEFKGLGKAKLSILKSAFEIANRFNSVHPHSTKLKLTFTQEVVRLHKNRMSGLKNEVFKIILLNPKNVIIDAIEISKGTPSGTSPLVREIVSKALQKFAVGIICIHNHPTGDPNPSNQDKDFTDTLKQTLKTIDIKLLDHIIFGVDSYYSFDKRIVENYV